MRKITKDIPIRETDEDEYKGGGDCVEACPVDAIRIEGDFPEDCFIDIICAARLN